MLINAGANLNLKDDFGNTALMLSIKYFIIDNIPKILIDAGAEIPDGPEYQKLFEYKINKLQTLLSQYTNILDDLELQYLSELPECSSEVIENNNNGIKTLNRCIEKAKKMVEIKPEYKKLLEHYKDIMVGQTKKV